MPSITFATIKGGVGKTTLAVHVAAALADEGREVLFLDLDPQGHASLVLGLEPGDRPCIADTFGPRPRSLLEQVIIPSPRRPNLRIAPACPRMFGLERELFEWGHRLQAIPRALKSLRSPPPVVVCDTPPSLGAFTEAALAFSDLVVAPVPTGAFALQGLSDVETSWRDVRDGQGQLVAAVNMLDRRTNATNAAMDEALGDLSIPVLSTRIPRAEVLNQAGLAYELVFETMPSAPVADELRSLSKELAARAGIT